MTESSRPWPGTGGGDGGAYTDAMWATIWDRLFGNAVANAGVLKGARSEFLATGGNSPVVVQPGSAVVNGTWYDSTANVNVSVPTPISSTRIDRIVLRKSVSAQTVRITRIAGAEGGSAPALTQTPGVTWDVPLWQVSITTGAAITFVADERVYAMFSSQETTAAPLGGRLTLTTGTPVTISDVLAAGTLYYTPWNSNRVPIYVNGSLRNVTFTEVSLSLSGAAADTVFDVFAYVDKTGTVQLETLAWSNSGAGTGARATTLTTQGGLRVKTGDISRTYLGTIRTTSSTGQTEDSEKRRYVWNCYNQVRRTLKAIITADAWSYTTNAWRAANADTTDGSGRVGVVIGLQEGEYLDVTVLTGISHGLSAANSLGSGGIGIDSTTVDSSTIRTTRINNGSTVISTTSFVEARYDGYPAIGYHQVQRIEIGVTTGGTSFSGDQTDLNLADQKPGLIGELLA
jgi:hypothetical protein